MRRTTEGSQRGSQVIGALPALADLHWRLVDLHGQPLPGSCDTRAIASHEQVPTTRRVVVWSSGVTPSP